MEDLGAPASYLTLAEGMPVYSSDGEELGKVEHVLADPDLDVFDGIVLDTSVLPGGRRFVDATQVAESYERGVVLTLDSGRRRATTRAQRQPRGDRGRPRRRRPRPASGQAAPRLGPDLGQVLSAQAGAWTASSAAP